MTAAALAAVFAAARLLLERDTPPQEPVGLRWSFAGRLGTRDPAAARGGRCRSRWAARGRSR